MLLGINWEVSLENVSSYATQKKWSFHGKCECVGLNLGSRLLEILDNLMEISLEIVTFFADVIWEVLLT